MKNERKDRQMNLRANPVRSSILVLGTLMKFPQLLNHSRMDLTVEDFSHNPMHEEIFLAINEIICRTPKVKVITPVDLGIVLEERAAQLNEDVLEFNGGNEFDFSDTLITAFDLANGEMFKFHYQKVKKLSLLRQFVAAGVDATKVLNYKEVVDLNLMLKDDNQFDFLGLNEVEAKLIECGKGDTRLERYFSDKVQYIDNQIEKLMKQKRNVINLQNKLS